MGGGHVNCYHIVWYLITGLDTVVMDVGGQRECVRVTKFLVALARDMERYSTLEVLRDILLYTLVYVPRDECAPNVMCLIVS